MKSWKTTLFGILSGAALGVTQVPGLAPHWQTLAQLAGALFIALTGMSARDAGVTSEQQGLKAEK